jgi:hypothetical protein
MDTPACTAVRSPVFLRTFSLHGLTRLRGGNNNQQDSDSNSKTSVRAARQSPTTRKAGDNAKRARHDAESSAAADKKHATKKARPGKDDSGGGGGGESASHVSRSREQSRDPHEFVSLGDSLPTDAIDQAYDMFSQESQVSMPPLR